VQCTIALSNFTGAQLLFRAAPPWKCATAPTTYVRVVIVRPLEIENEQLFFLSPRRHAAHNLALLSILMAFEKLQLQVVFEKLQWEIMAFRIKCKQCVRQEGVAVHHYCDFRLVCTSHSPAVVNAFDFPCEMHQFSELLLQLKAMLMRARVQSAGKWKLQRP
jgi:hypothetical protein